MGIDKPNVRHIVHGAMPASVEEYGQQAGRAGRDGLPSECLLLYDRSDRDWFLSKVRAVDPTCAHSRQHTC